ncbi:MAG: gliding motility-associated C-terminal domain-containing protein [Puia sp.]
MKAANDMKLLLLKQNPNQNANRRQNIVFGFFLFVFFGMTLYGHGQQRSTKNGNGHHLRTYRSTDNVGKESDNRLKAGLDTNGRDPMAGSEFLMRTTLSPAILSKRETRQFVVTGSLALNVATTGTICGQSNGSFDVKASGGTPPYLYSENGYPQQSSGYFDAKAPGAYIVTATDANSLSTTATIILTNTLDIPTVELLGYTNPTTCSSADGTMTVLGHGGTPPYTYGMWGFDYQSDNTIRNLPGSYAGYSILVKDANGCINTTGSFFMSTNCIQFQVGGISGACVNDGSLEAFNLNGGTRPYQFSLDGINYQADSLFSNLSSGIYNIYVKDANGLLQIKTWYIYQYCWIIVTVTADSPPCGMTGGVFTVEPNYGTPPYAYSIDGITFQSSNVFGNLKAGRYTITVKDVNGGYGTVDAAIDNSCLVAGHTTQNETCSEKNGSITAIANNGVPPYQYSIDGVNFQASNNFPNLASAQYTITLRDAAGQTATDIATVNSSCLDVTLSFTGTTCGNSNGGITVSVSNGAAPYQFSLNGIDFQPDNAFSGLQAGAYSITVKDANGLLSTATTTITDFSGPILAPVLSDASCNNTGGSINIISYGGTDPVQFSVDNGSTLKTDAVFNGLDSGQYIAYAKDANGCITRDTLYLTALPTPLVSLGNDTSLCEGGSITLTAPQEAGYSYQWQDNSNAGTYTVSLAGTYTVKVTNQFNCSASASVKVNFVPLPLFSLGNDTALCQGKIFALHPKPSTLPGTFLWSAGNTTAMLNIGSAGLYWLQVSNGGCSYRDSINVLVRPAPVIDLGNDTTLCDGQSLLLDVSNNNSTYQWQDGSVDPQYSVNKTGVYSVKVDEDGCDTSGSISVTYLSKPTVDLIKDTTLCITQELLLNAAYSNATYQWQDGSISPQFTVSEAGAYWVRISNGCGTVTDSTSVTYEDCTCEFYVPNAFTPNSDGRNDIFQPKYRCLLSDYELKIFNRYGQLIFVSRDSGVGWDGLFGSQQQPTGVYVWMLSYKDNLTGKDLRKDGTVVLIR